jgi:hypothetical protein
MAMRQNRCLQKCGRASKRSAKQYWFVVKFGQQRVIWVKMYKRSIISFLKVGLALAFLLTGNPVFPVGGNYGITEAQAQQNKRVRKKRRSLLQILFGGSKRVKRVTRRKSPKRRKNRRKRASIVTILPKVEKLENAKTVLVVGDFFASGLAKGLKRSFSQVPGVKIVSKTRGSSGFVRLDYYNWSEEIGDLIDEFNPSVVVSILGTNDRQSIRDDGNILKKRTEKWDAAYKVRVENFAKAIQVKQIPLVWMGLPPVRFKTANRDFLFFNEIYRSKAENVGGQFVDVWDGFTNAEGNFVASGPDVNGQIVRLRARDGINVTKSGQNKLAFYAEKSVRRMLGGSAPILAGLPQEFGVPTQVLAPSYDPARTGRTMVIRLDDPSLDGGNVLAGGNGPQARKVGELIVDNTGGDKSVDKRYQAGRADDAVWPRRAYVPPAAHKPKNSLAGKR